MMSADFAPNISFIAIDERGLLPIQNGEPISMREAE